MRKKMNFRKFIKLILPIGLLFLIVPGCIDEYENYTPYEKSVASFFDKVQTLEQSFSFEAEDGAQEITERQSIINIPANAFEDADGNLITGVVDFKYVEVLDKSLIILYDRPTLNLNDALLETAAVYYLEATQNDQKLTLNQNIEFRVVSDNTNEMHLSIWDESVERDYGNWTSVSTATAERSEWTKPGTTETEKGYQLLFNKLDWISCDQLIPLAEDQLSSLCLNFSENYNSTNTLCYLVFEDMNSVIKLIDTDQNQKYCYPADKASIGNKVSFVCISVIDTDQYELGIVENVVIEQNHTQDIEMESKSLEQILDILAEF